LLHTLAPPVWDERQTLAAVNEAAHSLGRPTLERLPQLFSAEACLVQTFPMIDPYEAQRTEDLAGPIFDRPPAEADASASAIFVYLSNANPLPSSVFNALKPHAARLRIFAPGLTELQRAELGRLGARIDPEPVPLADVLRHSRLVVHNGGSGVAAEALAAGIPQLVLSTHIDQNLVGEALQRSGVAELVRIYDSNAPLAPELVGALADDRTMAACAAKVGRWCRTYVQTHNSLGKLERVCLELLNVSRSSSVS
jgi:UDP:flavonoid glycosyltransferase YjiC (YdhE family)